MLSLGYHSSRHDSCWSCSQLPSTKTTRARRAKGCWSDISKLDHRPHARRTDAAVNAAPLRLGQAVAAPLCSGPATTADRGTVARRAPQPWRAARPREAMQICVPRRGSAFWQQRPSSTTVTIITTVIVLPGECCRKQGQLDHLTLTALSEWAAMRRQAYWIL